MSNLKHWKERLELVHGRYQGRCSDGRFVCVLPDVLAMNSDLSAEKLYDPDEWLSSADNENCWLEPVSLDYLLELVDGLLEANKPFDLWKIRSSSFSEKWKDAQARGALLAGKIEQLGFSVEWDEFGHPYFRRKEQ